MKIVLPLPPNMANGRMHWRTKNRKRENYFTLCHVVTARDGRHPAKPDQPLTKATVTVRLYVHNPMDSDNRMARIKWCLDFLKYDDWIVDDSDKVLTWTGIPTQAIDRKNPRVEIELEAA